MLRSSYYSLRSHNTFGLDVYADLFVEFSSLDELISLLHDPVLKEKKHFVIGGGSNLLFENDFQGVIYHSAIRGIKITKEDRDFVWLQVGSGMVWDQFVAHCVTQGWAGVENLSHIPGEVGACAVQNIGAYGVEAKDFITEVEAIEIRTGTRRLFTNSECRYAYRYSCFKGELQNKYIITHVTFRLAKHPQLQLSYEGIRQPLSHLEHPTLSDVRKAIIALREAKLPDPARLGNAGSFFMNPVIRRSQYEELLHQYPTLPHYPVDETSVKVPAGWMIEQCGWKGKNVGRAAVHTHQALVLVNLGGATSSEIIELAGLVADSVFRKFGIHITPEVYFVH